MNAFRGCRWHRTKTAKGCRSLGSLAKVGTEQRIDEDDPYHHRPTGADRRRPCWDGCRPLPYPWPRAVPVDRDNEGFRYGVRLAAGGDYPLGAPTEVITPSAHTGVINPGVGIGVTTP